MTHGCVCQQKSLATPENGITEPEAADDLTTGANEGELQDAINFVFWVDDGDNVLEVAESAQVWQGTAEEFMNTSPRIIADSTFNIFDQTPGTPVPGDSMFYIAKAWCFGELGLDPQSEDSTDPVTRGATGITCNGASVDNSTQTDGIEGNITFYAEQSRNNAGFECSVHYMPVEFLYDQNSDGDGDNAAGEATGFGYDAPYVTWSYVPGGVTLTFNNPTPWLFVFDVRVDNEAGIARDQTGTDLTTMTIGAGPLASQQWGLTYQRVEVDGRPTPDVHQVTQTFYGTNNIKVGLREGAERDWYIDWLTFLAQ